MNRPRRCQAGFTLIEVMIAVLIMALISLIAWRGLDSMTRTNDRLQARMEETARTTRALQQIEMDLTWRATVELPSAATEALAADGEGEGSESQGDAGGAPQTAKPGTPMMPLLPAGLSARRGLQGAFTFEVVRAAAARPGQWQRVQWWLQGGTLYRAAGEASSAYPLPAPSAADRVAVVEGVANFDMRAYEPGQGWRSLPTIRAVPKPATGLDVLVSVRRSAGPALQYRRVIALN
ncbi:prepilin-type N-terminal cleavage/methylation domain-containing protein [Bordetella genomosp. 13]|nr:prepilin-type N-terminal cleavage/methylation domain-containing protein [Bordetella genomosp. 13]